jgi:hypothetical protein
LQVSSPKKESRSKSRKSDRSNSRKASKDKKKRKAKVESSSESELDHKDIDMQIMPEHDHNNEFVSPPDITNEHLKQRILHDVF